jgi:Tol biopolymer transport system component
VRDLDTGATTLVSADSEGDQADGSAMHDPGLSANGRYVVYGSLASDLAPGDVNDDWDIFWKDLETGESRLVSDGVMPNGPAYHQRPHVTDDGRTIVFLTNAALTGADGNASNDVYLATLDP